MISKIFLGGTLGTPVLLGGIPYPPGGLAIAPQLEYLNYAHGEDEDIVYGTCLNEESVVILCESWRVVVDVEDIDGDEGCGTELRRAKVHHTHCHHVLTNLYTRDHWELHL